jgi:predicted alpha/beta-fold hydrolase
MLELLARDGLRELFAAGFSMGGNLILKMAGEFANSAPEELRGFAVVAPALDLAACANALCEPANILYQQHFVRRMKARMRYKASLFPGEFPIDGMGSIHSVRDFDDQITARFCGFENAADYYARSSACSLMSAIRRPTLILTAQDDPFVPFRCFARAEWNENQHITLLAPQHGGHCAFISNRRGHERFWSESCIVRFCAEQSRLLKTPKRPRADLGG